MADDGLLHNLIASQLLTGGMHALAKSLLKSTELPVPSNWLMHLVTVGRDVLGITGFNFQDNPVTPHTSFVNSLQEVPNYYLPPASEYLQLPGAGEFDIAELESPIKHYLQADDDKPSKSFTNRQISFSNPVNKTTSLHIHTETTQSQKFYPPPVYGKGFGSELFWTNPSVQGSGKMTCGNHVPEPGKMICGDSSLEHGKVICANATDYLSTQIPPLEVNYSTGQIEDAFVDQNPLRIKNSISKCQELSSSTNISQPSGSNLIKLNISNVIDDNESTVKKDPSSQQEIDNLSNKLSIVDTEIREEIDKIASAKSLISDLIETEDLTSTPDPIIDVVDQGKTETIRSEHLTPSSVHLTPQSEHLTPLESVSISEGTPLMVQIQNLQDLLTNTNTTSSLKKSKHGKNKLPSVTRKRGKKKRCSIFESNKPDKVDDRGESELLTELQRLLTSNIMSTDKSDTTKPSTKKRGRKRRDPSPLTVLPNIDHSEPPHLQVSPEALAGTSSKLFTELHRLLTQSSIRSAIQDDKQYRTRDLSPTQVSHPTSTSPPYIQAPQAYDQSSQDATTELYKTKNEGDKTLYSCPQCNKEFKTQQCLKRHIGRHLGVKPYPCLFCQKRFNDKANMHRHEKTHLNERSFVCDVCDEKFFRKEVLQMHVRAKHAIASDIITCKFKNCIFTCKVPSVLVEHIQTLHFNNYRYTCEHCNYKTSYSSNYKKHLRVHSGERPYKCKSCGKGFKQANALRMHNKIHIDRPHRCAICLKTFAVEVGLRIHYEHNHGPKAAQKGQKKAFEKQKKEIVKKYREQRNVHSKKLSFVNVMPTKL